MKYDAVIFDLFGTLVDIFSLEEYRVFLNDLCAVLGVAPAGYIKLWDETADERALGRVPVAEQMGTLCRELGVAVSTAQLERAVEVRVDFVRGALEPRADAVETLTRLKAAGHKIGVISDCSEEVVRAWPDTPLAPLVDEAVLSAAVGMRKPDPRVYYLACERLGVAPAKCLYVGDGGSRELSGAAAVGMEAVLIRAPEDQGDDAFRRDAEEWEGAKVSALKEILTLV
ncbi:MAG: HAD-IA family hydrolase [candidate division Zixibacteria bacterium]|nr:HAD-IA family hydrolase [candidate division Zixibacteria bacterium]